MLNEVRADTVGASEMNWGGQILKLQDAWKRTRGHGIRVAVLDTGVDNKHPDLQGRIARVYGIDGTTGYDSQGHGTWVTGQIVANGQVTGVAPEAQVVSIQVLGHSGRGTTNGLVKGITLAIQEKCRVVNLSLGLDKDNCRIHKAIRAAHKAGVITVAAAGNDANRLDYPARYPETIAVGAVDRHLNRAYFSDKGPGLAIMAPGVSLIGCAPGGGYKVLSGTSMATPFISGVVALMLAAHPEYGFDDVVRKLTETATDMNTPGWDPQTGYGLVNPPDAIAWHVIGGGSVVV